MPNQNVIPTLVDKEHKNCDHAILRETAVTKQHNGGDEYVYRITNPKHTHKYTEVKVLCAQDKHTQLSSFTEPCCHLIKGLADADLPEYVATHSQPTGYLHP